MTKWLQASRRVVAKPFAMPPNCPDTIPSKTSALAARSAIAALLLLVSGFLIGGCTTSDNDTVPLKTFPPCPISGCSDDDPCTDDFCHPVGGFCVNVPDLLCANDCESNADCAFANNSDECVSSQCIDGVCRHLALAESECVRCDPETPCPQSFCEPRRCENGFCRVEPNSCDDQDPNTLDVCDPSEAACRHWLAEGLRTCSANSDCKTDHPCETLFCNEGICQITADTRGCGDPLDTVRACTEDVQCSIGGGPTCIAGPCTNGFCQFELFPASPNCTPCTDFSECPVSYCRPSICTGTVCAFDDIPLCADNEAATVDECSESLQSCFHHYVTTPPNCTTAPDSDNDSTTIDVCNTQTGEPVYLPTGDDACRTPNKCWYTYVGPDGFCIGHPLRCWDGDPSTKDECFPDVGCVSEEHDESFRCEEDSECDDENPCTTNICLKNEEIYGCWGMPIDNCFPCENDSQCVADDWCYRGKCNEYGFCDFEAQRTCDDGDPCTVGFCHGLANQTCTWEVAKGCEAQVSPGP
jgi:hypothetical protein